MRKSAIGCGSRPGPSGVLRPRNVTPTNRQSTSQLHGGRKSSSLIPKLCLESEKKNYPHLGKVQKRISTEGLNRLSFASCNRVTPTRSNVPSLAPPCSSRSSIDSARSSAGGKSRKDVRPVNESSFKSQCIDKILEFLSNGYEFQFNRKVLQIPSTKDFIQIFNFIYNHIDQNYTLPNKHFEEEIPRILKMLKYPIQISRSSFVTVGSQHSWPSVLAMLAWLIDFVTIYESDDGETIAFLEDFAEDGFNYVHERFLTLSSYSRSVLNKDALQNNDEETQNNDYLENDFKKKMERACGLRQQDIHALQTDLGRLKMQAEQLQSGPERLQQLEQQNDQLLQDRDKISEFCREMQVRISVKDGELTQFQTQLVTVKGISAQLQDEIVYLKGLQSEQKYKAGDLAHFKNHAADVDARIKELEIEGKDFDAQIWSLEMELSKMQKNVSESIRSYNTICRQLELPEKLEISSGNVADKLQHWETEVVSELHHLKKIAKHQTFEAQNEKARKEEESNNISELVDEKHSQIVKLENKLRRNEEDIVLTKKEINNEEEIIHHECDRLHKQIMEARAGAKSSLYQKKCGLQKAREELEEVKAKVKDLKCNGMEFLMKVSKISQEYLEREERQAKEAKDLVEKICGCPS